jgi:hypothetical protein
VRSRLWRLGVFHRRSEFIRRTTELGTIGGPDSTPAFNLPGLTFDILLILALSSKRSRDYALRPRKEAKRDSSRPGGRAAY